MSSEITEPLLQRWNMTWRCPAVPSKFVDDIQDFRPGATLANGRYTLIGQLGSGSYGTAWKASVSDSSSFVVVKHPKVAGDPMDQALCDASLKRELGILQRVRDVLSATSNGPSRPHSENGVVHLVDGIQVKTGPGTSVDCVITSFVDGEPLIRTIERIRQDQQTRIPPALFREWIVGLAESLELLERAGVVHGDLSGNNVLVDPYPALHPVICDFGEARIAGETIPGAPGAAFGALAIAAPELCVPCDGGRFKTASNVYSFGSLVFALATGLSPFQATKPDYTDAYTEAAFVRKGGAEKLGDVLSSALSEANTGIRGLAPLVERSLWLDSSARPTAGELVIASRNLRVEQVREPGVPQPEILL